MVSWGCVVNWSWFVSWSFVFTWGSFICYFHNVSRVSISSVVFDYLSTAIRKEDTVFSGGRVAVTTFISSKSHSSVFISYGIFILVFSWDISVCWLMISSWFGVVGWGRFVDRGWMVNWGWCWVVDGSWVVDRSWVVNWSWFVSRSVMNGCVGNGVAVSL